MLQLGGSSPAGQTFRWSQSFPEVLLVEFLHLCIKTKNLSREQSFGRSYIQEQFGIAVSIYDKRVKGRAATQKPPGLEDRSGFNSRSNEYQELIPRDAVVFEAGALKKSTTVKPQSKMSQQS